MNELGHDYDAFYVCQVCRVSQYDAENGQIVCTAADVADEPVIIEVNP